jgi:glyoxylase-like metal-dependent hydrolase (beta-lactamase superfamily II)
MKIHTIDQEFLSSPQVIASYLLEGDDGLVLIETGPASTQATLERKVCELGFELTDVKHVLVTHIHLDHSGGAGYWAQRGSQVYVHSRGARHLISPDKLLASAGRIYLDRMEELWGTTIAIPEERVTVFEEGTRNLSGLEVTALDTPGHARHHLAFQVGNAIFAGDVAACCLPGCKFPSVPGPPPEFDKETWKESLDKLRSAKPEQLFLTHFGQVDNPAEYLDALQGRLDECVDFVAERMDIPMADLEKAYSAWDKEQAKKWGVSDENHARYEKANPSFMSAQGIRRYVERRQK